MKASVKKWSDSSAESNEDLENVLKWLWHSAAEPVLDRLRLAGPEHDEDELLSLDHLYINRPENDGTELPRLWWVSCDWVNRLPIHAAGDHRKAAETGSPCSVMDRVVSSYCPTLRSLKYLRSRVQISTREDTESNLVAG